MGRYLAPECRLDLRQAVFRLLSSLAKRGVTVIVAIGLEQRFTELRFSLADLSLLTDAIVAMRYVEMASRIAKLNSVVKVCITDASLVRFDGLLSGHPSPATSR